MTGQVMERSRILDPAEQGPRALRRGRADRRTVLVAGAVALVAAAAGVGVAASPLIALLVVLSLGFVGVVVRLASVQGFSARRYAVFGESQRLHTVVLPAERGAILDRNMVELAVSARRQTVWADPTAVRSIPHPRRKWRDQRPVAGPAGGRRREPRDPCRSASQAADRASRAVSGSNKRP